MDLECLELLDTARPYRNMDSALGHRHGGDEVAFLREQGCTDRGSTDPEPGADVSGRREIKSCRRLFCYFAKIYGGVFDFRL